MDAAAAMKVPSCACVGREAADRTLWRMALGRACNRRALRRVSGHMAATDSKADSWRLRNSALTRCMPPTLAAGALPLPTQLFDGGTVPCPSGYKAVSEVTWVCDPTKAQDQLQGLFSNGELRGAPTSLESGQLRALRPFSPNRLPLHHMHRPDPALPAQRWRPVQGPKAQAHAVLPSSCRPHRTWPADNTCRISFNVLSAKAWWVVVGWGMGVGVGGWAAGGCV